MRLILVGILLLALNYAECAYAQVSIETQDGLRLNFGDSGNITDVCIENKALPLLEKPGGFFIEDIERTRQNLMPNSDFEKDNKKEESKWQFGALWKIAEENGQHYAQAISETMEGTGNIRSPKIQVKPGTRYLVTGKVRTSSDASKFSPGLYIVQYDSQGKLVKVPTARGEIVQIGIGIPRSATKFTQVSAALVTQPDTVFLQIYANIYRGIGKFGLDEVSLAPIEAVPTIFPGKIQSTNKGAIFSGYSKELGLILEATFTSYANHIKVDGKVRDTTGKDRPLRVRFNLPVDADSWTWWDDIEESRQISGNQRYAYYGTDWGVGKGRQVSVFPFAGVTNDSVGLSLAQSVDQPRFFRIFYDASAGYCIDYGLGLAAETRKFPSSASFHFLIYHHDPEWGMRASIQKYYDIFPDFFKVRAERQGLYCYDVPTDLPNPEDFGFCFDLAGFGYAKRKKLKEHGIYLLVHPMGTEAHVKWPGNYDWGTENGRPSLEQIEDIFLTQRPEYREGASWRGLTLRDHYATFEENRRRVVNSAIHDIDGHFQLYPYSDTIQFIATSADPDIASPNMADGERNRIRRHIEIATKAGSQLDGADFDNIAITAGRKRENFRREHFQYVDHPLIYNLQTRGVCIQTGIGFYEFVKDISEEMHAQGNLCTGNFGSDPHTQTIFGHLLDKHGGEIHYDAPMRHLRGYRMMAYQKPIAHIIYKGSVAAGQEETVMHRWLAFGEFPTITELSYRGADFERGRPLYKRFIPAMQRIAYAGWEPITHASVDIGSIFVERFGNWNDNDLHFAVHNDSDKPKVTKLFIDKLALGIVDKPMWVELLGNEMLSADGQMQVDLQPHHTKVFSLFSPKRGNSE